MSRLSEQPLAAREDGLIWAGEGHAIERLRQALERGEPWWPALLTAIRRWDRVEDEYDGRRYLFLIDGEAFDWLALVERFVAELGPLFPLDEVEQLLFYGAPPGGFDEAAFQEAIGPAKYRTVLNYHYGVVVEEALWRAVEEEVAKSYITGLTPHRRLPEETAERIYGLPLSELLARFREDAALPPGERISYLDWKRFTYWRFKFRLRQSHRVKVAADTKRGLDTLERLRAEALSGLRSDEDLPRDPDPIELAPWRFRVVR
ncbi:MAG: hypothetical protein RMM58_13690 [Chloroflexota bacterium]|nr:hypothetical protein [Dehalococcoidia bacterium]MDW8254923.1 hypothetical protein [Chloroflexota bacterium]